MLICILNLPVVYCTLGARVYQLNKWLTTCLAPADIGQEALTFRARS